MSAPKPITAQNWDTALNRSWEGYKARYIFCGANCGDNLGLVFDPSQGYTAVSEGIGYGLLMAVLMNDQPTFDTIYNAANRILWDQENGLYHWRADNSGTVIGDGSATDADQDIALALIFAQERVLAGEWTAHTHPPYDERANLLIDLIYEKEIYDGQFIKPGDQWEVDGQTITNLSYFSPAWYRIYDVFQGTDRWTPVIDQGYETLYATEGADLGLTPDWSQADGAPAFDYCDAYGRTRETCRYEMYYDAIRVPWRIATDCLWFDEPRACEWATRGTDFLLNIVGSGNPRQAASGAVMFDMTGNPIVPQQDSAMIGMWLAGVTASGNNALMQALSNRLWASYTVFLNSDGFWGNYWEEQNYYFNQTLAWFGAAVAGNAFINLYPIS